LKTIITLMSVLVLCAIAADIPEEEDSSITINGQEFPCYSKEVTTSLSPVERWSVPYSVTVISPNASQNIGSNNAADLLEHQAGLTVAHYGGVGNLSNLSMRGSQTGAVLVLKDGIPINDIQSGGIDLNLVATGGLGQAELVQGPGASTVYGANAMGGVVNFVSAPLSKERIWVKGAGSYGTDNTTDVKADFSVPFTNKLALGVGAGIAHSDGFREHSKSDIQEQSMALEYGTTGAGFGSALRFSRIAKNLEIAGPASSPVDENALQKDDMRLVGWNGAYQDESSYVAGTASYRNGSLEYRGSGVYSKEPLVVITKLTPLIPPA
jgi:outer membrane cobalamin receptor